mmetsp:Transcript_63947/g.178906  ORF Transcript_63947/g.178906 Transcript_63947/m.178906 type:complete len:172 (-) Transcript_63947:264-779(-)
MVSLDNQLNKLQVELIHKEERLRWNHTSNSYLGNSIRSGAEAVLTTPRTLVGTTPRRSAAMRFLEEKTGLVTCGVEYADQVRTAEERPSTREWIYHGISREGGGRAQYLKERKKYTPTERHGHPMTFAMTYGASPSNPADYVASPNCKKPIIQQSFFRTSGTATHRDLPAQ